MYICFRKFELGLLEMFEEGKDKKKEPLSEFRMYFARLPDFEKV